MQIEHHIRQERFFVLSEPGPGRFLYFVMDAQREAVSLERARRRGVKVLRVHDSGF